LQLAALLQNLGFKKFLRGTCPPLINPITKAEEYAKMRAEGRGQKQDDSGLKREHGISDLEQQAGRRSQQTQKNLERHQLYEAQMGSKRIPTSCIRPLDYHRNGLADHDPVILVSVWGNEISYAC
jgi:hypothetical protein